MSPNLEISTVVGCRMNCDYCPQKVHVKNYFNKSDVAKMGYSDFAMMLDKVPRNVEIVFAGMAEPWLNPDCTDMVVAAHRAGFKVGVYSTLYGMSEYDVQVLSKIPFMFFSLHLPDADGIMRLPIDLHYLKVLELFHKNIPHNSMVVGKLHPYVEKITGPVADHSAGLFSRAGNLKTLTINPKKGKLECSACGPKIDHNVLLPNGDVLLCCMVYDLKHVIGNLMTGTYESLFESDEYKRVIDGLQQGDSDIACRKCEVSKQI